MTQITLKIDGMSCSMCEAHINDTIRRNFDVKKVSSSHSKGQTIIITQQDIDEQSIKDAINPTGYKVLSISKSPYKRKHLLNF